MPRPQAVSAHHHSQPHSPPFPTPQLQVHLFPHMCMYVQYERQPQGSFLRSLSLFSETGSLIDLESLTRLDQRAWYQLSHLPIELFWFLRFIFSAHFPVPLLSTLFRIQGRWTILPLRQSGSCCVQTIPSLKIHWGTESIAESAPISHSLGPVGRLPSAQEHLPARFSIPGAPGHPLTEPHLPKVPEDPCPLPNAPSSLLRSSLPS